MKGCVPAYDVLARTAGTGTPNAVLGGEQHEAVLGDGGTATGGDEP